MAKAIPDDYPQVMPYLIVDGAKEAIEFYKGVLGATERMRLEGPDGKIGHAELEIGESVIMLADENLGMNIEGPEVDWRHARLDTCLHRGCRRRVRAGGPSWSQAVASGRRSVLWGSLWSVRGSVWPPLERGHARRGHLRGGDVAARG